MPAPMIAPTPSAVSWKGPSVRFRLCALSSWASESSMLIGFRANKGLPMQLLLYAESPERPCLTAIWLGTLPASRSYIQLPASTVMHSIVGAQRAAPLTLNLYDVLRVTFLLWDQSK